MKPKYSKPELFFESYELSAHMAACGWDLQHANESSCHADKDIGLDNQHTMPERAIFTGTTPGCKITATPGQQSGGSGLFEYCYTNGASDQIRVLMS